MTIGRTRLVAVLGDPDREAPVQPRHLGAEGCDVSEADCRRPFRRGGRRLERAARVRPGFTAGPEDLAVVADVVRTLDGITLHVHAARYVLALGGIENARVLLASRSQHREGVANGHDVVGRYFMEHPHYYGSIGVVHPLSVNLSFYVRAASDLKRSDGTPVEILGALGLAAKVSRSEKLLNFSATFAAHLPEPSVRARDGSSRHTRARSFWTRSGR